MRHNAGNADRTIRILIAVAIASAGFIFKSWWGILAIIPFATAIMGWCPIYSLIGVNTCKYKQTRKA